MWTLLHQVTSPRYFYSFARKILPWASVLCFVFFLYGLVGGLFLAPPDYQQGDAYRIIYIHVPCAVLSLLIFICMGIMGGIYLIWHIKLADVIAKCSAYLGAWFTFLALVTGSIWGKPMWGTWWIWDARLTSELILLFLYLGIIGLRSAIPSLEISARATAIFTLIGLVDIPIIHYSVNWWNTLHQKATLLKFATPSISSTMLYPLLAMLIAFTLYYIALLLVRVRTELLLRESKSEWVKEILSHKKIRG